MSEKILWGWLSLLLIMTFLPMLNLVIISFNPKGMPIFPPESLSLYWYKVLFGTGSATFDPRIVSKSIQMSLIVAFCTALGTSTVTFLAARQVRRLSPRHQVPFMLAMVGSLFIPAMSLGVAISYFCKLLHIKTSFFTLLITHMVYTIPFGFIVLLVAYAQFNDQLMEAAADLGAPSISCVKDIELPLIRGGLLGAFLFSFLLSFNEVTRAILTRGAFDTLPTYLYAKTTRGGFNAAIYSLSSVSLIGTMLAFTVGAVYLTRRQRSRI